LYKRGVSTTVGETGGIIGKEVAIESKAFVITLTAVYLAYIYFLYILLLSYIKWEQFNKKQQKSDVYAELVKQVV